MKRLLVLPAAAALLLATPAAQTCWEQEKFSRLGEARRCFAGLARSGHAALRAEGLWGLRDYQAANEAFRAALAAFPKDVDVRVRWGRFFLERYNPAEAATLFNEALELKPDYPPALLGLALVASDGFEQRAVELAERALAKDPQLVEAQELLAYLALEDSNVSKAQAEAEKALQLSARALDAMAVLAAIDLLNDQEQTPWIERILQLSPRYSRAWSIPGHFFVLNRRYEEGIEAYRKALELDPRDDAARVELGLNLMRLGREKEAREHLERAYENGYRNAATVNTLTLMDSYKDYVTWKTDKTIVRVHKKESDLLGPYIQRELERAVATFEKKYRMKLERPVQVEVYPNHDDFAVRTMGIPGLGALGVTFGSVVAMDSPSGRKPGQFHWASTLWHELSHVFVLAATKHRVPRWFTEGLAVHEETAASSDWGDRLDPVVIRAVQEKRLLPVSELDRGFIRPSYPGQVVVSYFQAGRICDYINERWGYAKLLEMMHDFGRSTPTAAVIKQRLQLSPEEFDQQFLAWLDGQIGPTVRNFNSWRKQIKELSNLFAAKAYQEVVEKGPAIRDLYPDFVEAGNAYELIYKAHLELGNPTAARQELERYWRAGGRDPELIKKLATMQRRAGLKAEAAQTLERLIYVYPIDEELHRWLGELWLELGRLDDAIREFQAVIAMRPLDEADSRYNLARALKDAKRIEEAKEQLLLALEAAPGFRPAQKLLLELSQ